MATHAATRNISGLARALAQHGVMSEAEAEALQTQSQSSGVPFVEQVLSGKRLSAQQLAVFASRAFGVPLLDLAGFDADQISKEYFDTRLAQTRRVLPLHKRGNRLYVATSDPANLQALDEVRFKTNLVVEPVVVEDDKLGIAIAKLVEASGANMKDMAALEDIEVTLEDGTAQPAQADEDSEVEDAPVVRYIQKVLIDAITSGASDIHFEPYERYYRIRYRLDGILMEVAQPPLAIKDKVASRIKVISKLDISEKRVPQDGRMKLMLSKNRAIDFRVSTLPTLFGESCVMRVLDRSVVALDLDRVGLQEEDKRIVEMLLDKPHGIVLVTGPTGSGKTTTLYSMLNKSNEPTMKIITTEDPVEYDLEGIVQVPINDEIGVSYAAVLRTILRQDPDIILVGETRDLETAKIAIEASLTGHLVFTTLHTNDAPSAVVRLVDLGVEPYLLAATLNAIVAQRLIRRVCKSCRKTYEPGPEIAAQLELDPAELAGKKFAFGEGCEECARTGYKGRVALFEILVITPRLRRAILENWPQGKLRELALEEGMVNLRQAGVRRVFEGVTTVEEVVRETFLEA